MATARQKGTEESGRKVQLRFKTFEGEIKEVEASVGETLLQVGKREGLPAIEGVCGGKLGKSKLQFKARIVTPRFPNVLGSRLKADF